MFRVFPEALDPCFACFTLPRSSPCNAYHRQAKAYDKRRRPVEEMKVGDYTLVNPHSLELVDIAGTGKKLIQ